MNMLSVLGILWQKNNILSIDTEIGISIDESIYKLTKDITLEFASCNLCSNVEKTTVLSV